MIRFPFRRWWRRPWFWAFLPLALLVLMLSLLFIAGQILQRTMVIPEVGDLRRAEVELSLDRSRGVKVSYLQTQTEEGLPLVYVHGTPGDATNFTNFLRHPVGGRRSIAIDRPGFGRSTTDRSFVRFEDQATAVLAVLDDLGIDRAVLVGHSLGGPIVARAAADHPRRVAGILLAAGSLDPALEKLEWYNTLLQWWPFTKALPRAFLRSNEEVLAARRQCESLAPELEKVRCPVMIVHGTADRLVPFANAEYSRRELSHASRVEVRVLEGADHFLPWAQESELRAAIEELLGWVDAGPAAS